MRGIKFCIVLLAGVFVLIGCATPSTNDVTIKSVSATSQRSATMTASSTAMVTDIGKRTVPDKPDVTRVMFTLDQKTSHSTSREGNRLIINIFSAKMKSSIQQLDVQDPVITSITTKQVGNSVKSVIELISQDVAYRSSTSTTEEPYQVFIDIWQISPKTGLKQSVGTPVRTAVPAPVQSLSEGSPQVQSPESGAGERTKEITLDLQAPSSKEVMTAAPSSSDVPVQLEWFSEKLSQVVQERERLKQQLLESEKGVAVKDSMIQVLERKLKEANTRIVELEEELIKMKSTISVTEALREEFSQILSKLEQASGTPQTSGLAGLSLEDQIRTRSDKLLERIAVLQQESVVLGESQTEIEGMKAQIARLTQERDALKIQSESYASKLQVMRESIAKLSAIEGELRGREVELARLRQAVGAATEGISSSEMSSPSDVRIQPTMSEGSSQVLSASELPMESEGAREQLVLAELLQQQQLAPVSPDEYVLGPDDVVQIKVLNEENLDKTVTVSSDGFITYPLLGDLRVDGLTTAQADAQITSLLARDFLVDPEVIVEVVKQRSKKVYIMGMVKQPGYHEITGDQRLLGTLLNAGGPTSFETELRVLRLPKGDMFSEVAVDTMSPIVVDLERLFVDGDQTQNIILRDGDVLMVAQKTATGSSPNGKPTLGPNQFYVVGSVGNPGVYTYQANDTVLDAVLRAGGFTEFASMNSTKLVRESDGKTRTFQVKMKDVMEKGEMDKNIKIMPGDMIIVPESFF